MIFIRKAITIAIFIGLNFSLFSQNCFLSLSGYVTDRHENSPLAFSSVLIKESGRGTVVDTAGFFTFDKLCSGDYHLQVSHIGCEPASIFVRLKSDTVIFVELEHHAAFLQAVEIEGGSPQSSSRTQSVISGKELQSGLGKSLSELILNVPGVSAIKGGSGISKPVIHGLYGNRVSVINNGIVQAGQQWGNDHSPEIDPFAAKQITVIKGVEAIDYGGNGLGGIVLVDPGTISSDPHLHGAVYYLYNTNGKGHTASSQLEQGGKLLNWRVTGTLKQIGDRESPDYYLTNTGNRESNFSVQLAKRIGSKWFNNLYYSYFNTDLGILRGAVAGNLTDLEEAVGREVPLYTNNSFSYEINAPRQEVRHHLLKASSKYFISDNKSVEVIYSFQLDQRKEFDVRRGGRSGTPALDLNMHSHFWEGNFSGSIHHKLDYKFGVQLRFNENVNDAETGILPLIPNYLHTNAAIYGRVKYRKARTTYELGSRYDFMGYEVNNISVTLPKVAERNEHQFHNYTISAGTKFDHRLNFASKFNVGFTQRSPEVNELYSFGLHQGVAGIEEGNRGLNPERSLKAIWTSHYSPSDKLFFQGSVYYQLIDDYIYLEPQDEFRLTIRGAFPVFLYKQTEAALHGVDLQLKYRPFKRVEWETAYSMVRGNDRQNNLPLVYMPPDRIFSNIGYTFPLKGKFESITLSANGKYVFEQTRLEPEQDYLLPPDDYWLLGASASTEWKRKKTSIGIFVQADNLLNAVYRDYLNRLRYYANAEGLNVRFGLKFGF